MGTSTMISREEFLKKYYKERQRCEVWTRVMGYHRPVSSYNPGKRQEHEDRTPFKEQSIAGAGFEPTT